MNGYRLKMESDSNKQVSGSKNQHKINKFILGMTDNFRFYYDNEFKVVQSTVGLIKCHRLEIKIIVSYDSHGTDMTHCPTNNPKRQSVSGSHVAS